MVAMGQVDFRDFALEGDKARISRIGRRERERESAGTGILFEEPNPTGSRPSDLIGLYTKWQRAKRPQPAKRSSREEGGAT